MAVNLQGIGKDEDAQVARLAYERLVADRLDLPRWTISDRQKVGMMRRVCTMARSVDADPVEFILAQFLFFDEEECRMYFGFPYLPINAMVSKGAKSRYERWRRSVRKPEEMTVKNIARRIEYDSALVKLVDGEEHRVLLLCASGALSVWYFAYRQFIGEIEENEAFHFVQECFSKREYERAVSWFRNLSEKEKIWLRNDLK